MDRQAHDYAAMAFAQQQHQAASMQQQQQFGFHPQHQQFPPSAHGPPFLPAHSSLQQFPYPRPIQQPQLHPHTPPPHLLHLQQQQQPSPAFPPHMPPHHVPSPFHNPYDAPPPPSPPPSDPELQKRIDKLIEYAVKNGPEFEAMIREKQQDNPAYSFLFGGEGHYYYRYKLWMATRPPGGPFNAPFHPPNPMRSPSPLNAPYNGPNAASGASAAMLGPPHLNQPPFPPFYDQQPPQPFGRADYDQSYRSFKGLSRPLPSDVELELNNVLNSLTGTKESIRGAKNWFMQRSPFIPALAEALRDRIFSLDDSERQLHIVYLANDIMFESLQRRVNPHELDNEALAFKPVLGPMLARIFYNPQNKEENQSRLQKIIQFWGSKEVYDQDTIRALENEMMSGLPANFSGPQRELSADPAAAAGLSHQVAHQTALQWKPDGQVPPIPNFANPDKPVPPIPAAPPQQFHPGVIPPTGFPGSMPVPSSVPQGNLQAAAHSMPALTANSGGKLPPYPLFPPGLIPGMVRKMQIGSGVPYSPMSPLDIPTIIPPSTMSESEILEKVSKFFREIGEVNPSEGPVKPSNSANDYDNYEREPLVRKGGACIPPPPNLQADPETGTYPDGSVEQKPGLNSSGRLGLGATANPNESSQYDDVYSSYRKERSTNYHSSMSARATR